MISDQILLSVIVPIYKVEDYLTQCIESLLSQSFYHMEILLIDDGSTDGCGAICDAYEAKDTRIKSYHKVNGGNADALNYGMGIAQGKYVAFVDGDDYINNKDAFQLLISEAIQSEADIIVGNYHKDVDGKLVPAKALGFDQKTDKQSIDFRFAGFYSIGHLAYTWGKLYKRSFLMQHQLLMKHYVYAFDKLFNIECYIHNPDYSFISDSVYVYRSNQNSISHIYKKDFAEIWLNISEEIFKDIAKLASARPYSDLVAYHMLFAVFFSCKQEYEHQGYIRSAIVAELKKFRKHRLMQYISKAVCKGKYLGFQGNVFWKLMLWGLSTGLCLKLYGLMSFGIKLLVDFNIDGSLSSTGNYNRNH